MTSMLRYYLQRKLLRLPSLLPLLLGTKTNLNLNVVRIRLGAINYIAVVRKSLVDIFLPKWETHHCTRLSVFSLLSCFTLKSTKTSEVNMFRLCLIIKSRLSESVVETFSF